MIGNADYVDRYSMKTFEEFAMENGSEELLTEIFGWGRNKLYDHPEYGRAFTVLVKKHNGDEKAAEAELRQLASTTAGDYQLKRMNMSASTDKPEDTTKYSDAQNRSGSEMMGEKPGSYRHRSNF